MNKFEIYDSVQNADYSISLIKQFLDNPDSSKVIDAFIFHFNSIADWGEVKEHIINNDDRKTATAIANKYRAIGNLSDAEKVIIKHLRGNEKFKSTIINFGRFRAFLDYISEWLADGETSVNNGEEELNIKQADVKKTANRRNRTFADLIQYEDKEKLLKRLHHLIDGHSGAEVGAVLLRAYSIDHYLTRCPTRAEYESEFELIGGWDAIRNFISRNNSKSSRANDVIIL